MKEATLSEQLAALPYEVKVRICFRLLKSAGCLKKARAVGRNRGGGSRPLKTSPKR